MSVVQNSGIYISGIDSNNTNALASDLLVGKTAISNGSGSTQLITGTMTENGTLSPSSTLGINGTYTYTVPKGHIKNGTLTVTQSIPTKSAQTYYFSSSAQTISAGQYLTGAQTIKGIPFKGAQTYTPSTSNQTISAGYYLSDTQTILGDSNLVSGNIASGVTIFNVSGNLENYGTTQYVYNYGTWGSICSNGAYLGITSGNNVSLNIANGDSGGIVVCYSKYVVTETQTGYVTLNSNNISLHTFDNYYNYPISYGFALGKCINLTPFSTLKINATRSDYSSSSNSNVFYITAKFVSAEKNTNGLHILKTTKNVGALSTNGTTYDLSVSISDVTDYTGIIIYANLNKSGSNYTGSNIYINSILFST
jgi:hypothetical protein